VASIIIETLKQTIKRTPVNLLAISQTARTTSDVANEVLTNLTGLQNPSGAILGPSSRFKLALDAVQLGAFLQVARVLTWQEFEEFSEECLGRAGFETQRGQTFSDSTRRWQIDITAVKNHILLAVDCKHWESPNYASKFNKAVEHQKESLAPLIRHMRRTKDLDDQEVYALPVILTLYEPRGSLLNGAVIVSVTQLPEFLERLTPYDSELPFVTVRKALSVNHQPRQSE